MRGPEMAHCAHHSDAIREFWLRLSFSLISGVTKVLGWVVPLLQLALETTGQFHSHSTDLRRLRCSWTEFSPLPASADTTSVFCHLYGCGELWSYLFLSTFTFLLLAWVAKWFFYLRDSELLTNISYSFFVILCCGGFLILDLWICLYVLCFFLLETSIILIMDSFPFC